MTYQDDPLALLQTSDEFIGSRLPNNPTNIPKRQRAQHRAKGRRHLGEMLRDAGTMAHSINQAAQLLRII